MTRFKRKFTSRPDRIVHPVRVRASRAIVESAAGQMPRVAMQFEDAAGVVYQFELDVKEAAEMIETATSAYHAIVPVLKTSRHGFGA